MGCNLWDATYEQQGRKDNSTSPGRHWLTSKAYGGGEGREAGGRRGGWVERNLHPSKCPGQVAWGSEGLFRWGCNSSKDFLPDPLCLVENTETSPQTCPALTWHVQWSSLPGASSTPGVPPKLAPGGVLSDTKPNMLIRYLVGGSFPGRFPEMGDAASPPPSRIRESLVEWMGIPISTSPDTIR